MTQVSLFSHQLTGTHLPIDAFSASAVLLAFNPILLGCKLEDPLAISGRATSVPSFAAAADVVVAFLAIAFGSNLPP